MYRHLLVPLDGSPISTGLVAQAIAYASACSARITFFHAVPDFGATDEGALQRTLEPEWLARRSSAEADQVLLPAVAAGRAAGIECDGDWRIADSPHEAIQAAAADNRCDLIFIASHGKRGFDRLILGSQTAKLVARASFPILLVRVRE